MNAHRPARGKILVAVLVAAALLVPAGAASTASAAPASPAVPASGGPELCGGPYGSSSGWALTGTCIYAGWGLPTGNYTSITGDFQVPLITGSDGSFAYIWYGLGGGTLSGALEQVGVATYISAGKPIYKGFWEVVYCKKGLLLGGCDNSEPSSGLHELQQTVQPGDWMDASVTYSGNDAFLLYLKDVSRGWYVQVPVTSSDENGKTSNWGAEAVVEDPYNPAPDPAPLADFDVANIGNIRIDNSYAWVHDNPTEDTLGTGKVYISPLDSGGDFTVTWEHS